MTKQFYVIVFLFLGMFLKIDFTNAQETVKPFFTIEGEVLKPLQFTVEDLAQLEQVTVKTKGMDGNLREHQGVALVDLLTLAGVTLGKELRGENLTKYLLLKATDGYEVIYALAEVDPEFAGQTIIVAYKVDGNPLPKGEGPFRIIAPNDKRPARWIRELSSIKVLFAQ